MCGRYNLHQTYLLKNRFQAVNQISISPDYNRSPGTINPVIISKFHEIGVSSKNAFDTQALLELKNNYCAPKRCLECAIGNTILKR